MPPPHYAVPKGRTPGIYTNWDDAKAQTHEYSGNQVKKFNDVQAADKFMAEGYGGGYKGPNPNGKSGAARGQPDYAANKK